MGWMLKGGGGGVVKVRLRPQETRGLNKTSRVSGKRSGVLSVMPFRQSLSLSPAGGQPSRRDQVGKTTAAHAGKGFVAQ